MQEYTWLYCIRQSKRALSFTLTYVFKMALSSANKQIGNLRNQGNSLEANCQKIFWHRICILLVKMFLHGHGEALQIPIAKLNLISI